MYTFKKQKEGSLSGIDQSKCKNCQYHTSKCDIINKSTRSTHSQQHPICWCCMHMTDGTCQFSMFGTPVEGSVIIKRRKKTGHLTNVYTNVRECPNFERG